MCSSMHSKRHLTAGDQPYARCEARILSSPSIHAKKGEYSFCGKGRRNSVQLRQAEGSSVTAGHEWQKQAVWSLYSALPILGSQVPIHLHPPHPQEGEPSCPRKVPLGTC